jgi:hypothetical protein
MHKAICVASFLLAALASTSAGAPVKATPISLPLPVIVARGKLLKQTASVPATTIFTPTQGGLYRLSMYSTVTVANPATNDNWYTYLFWTDDAGSEQTDAVPLSWNSGNSPPYAWGNGASDQPGLVLTFELAARTPLSFTVNGVTDGSEFSLYYVVERLVAE